MRITRRVRGVLPTRLTFIISNGKALLGTMVQGPHSRCVFDEVLMDSMGIGALAKRAGVNIDTVRYYERNALLAPRTRLASGYRRYGDLELARLRFIRRAQGLGFTPRDQATARPLDAAGCRTRQALGSGEAIGRRGPYRGS
jgi:hypothetical protein